MKLNFVKDTEEVSRRADGTETVNSTNFIVADANGKEVGRATSYQGGEMITIHSIQIPLKGNDPVDLTLTIE